MADGGMGPGPGRGQGAGSGGPAPGGGGSAPASAGTGGGSAGAANFAQPVSHPGIQEPVSGSVTGARTDALNAHEGMEATTHGQGSQVGAPVSLPRPQGKD